MECPDQPTHDPTCSATMDGISQSLHEESEHLPSLSTESNPKLASAHSDTVNMGGPSDPGGNNSDITESLADEIFAVDNPGEDGHREDYDGDINLPLPQYHERSQDLGRDAYVPVPKLERFTFSRQDATSTVVKIEQSKNDLQPINHVGLPVGKIPGPTDGDDLEIVFAFMQRIGTGSTETSTVEVNYCTKKVSIPVNNLFDPEFKVELDPIFKIATCTYAGKDGKKVKAFKETKGKGEEPTGSAGPDVGNSGQVDVLEDVNGNTKPTEITKYRDTASRALRVLVKHCFSLWGTLSTADAVSKSDRTLLDDVLDNLQYYYPPGAIQCPKYKDIRQRYKTDISFRIAFDKITHYFDKSSRSYNKYLALEPDEAYWQEYLEYVEHNPVFTPYEWAYAEDTLSELNSIGIKLGSKNQCLSKLLDFKQAWIDPRVSMYGVFVVDDPTLYNKFKRIDPHINPKKGCKDVKSDNTDEETTDDYYNHEEYFACEESMIDFLLPSQLSDYVKRHGVKCLLNDIRWQVLCLSSPGERAFEKYRNSFFAEVDVNIWPSPDVNDNAKDDGKENGRDHDHDRSDGNTDDDTKDRGPMDAAQDEQHLSNSGLQNGNGKVAQDQAMDWASADNVEERSKAVDAPETTGPSNIVPDGFCLKREPSLP